MHTSVVENRSLPNTAMSRWPHRVIRQPLFWLVIVAGMFLALAPKLSAQGLADRQVQLDVEGSSGASVIDLEAISHGEAIARLSDGTGPITLPVLPLGSVPTDVGIASFEVRSDGAPSLAMTAAAQIFGLQVDVLVTTTWDDLDDTTGTTAVVFDLGGADLSAIVQTDLPVALSDTLVALGLSPQTLDGSTLPPTAQAFLADGSALPPTMEIAQGISVRALVDGTDAVLAQVAQDIGLEPSIRLEGSLSGSVAALFGGAPVDPVEASLTASVVASTAGGQLPDHVAPTGVWTLKLSADTSGALAASVDGELAVSIGSTTTNVALAAGIEYAAPDVSVTLTAAVGPIPNLFGQDWLDLESTVFTADIHSSDGVSASLEAKLALADLTGDDGTADVTFAFDANSGGVSGSLDIDASAISASVPIPALADGLGDVAAVMGDADLTLSGFVLSLSFDTTNGFSGTAAVTSSAGLDVGSTSIDGNLLLRAEFGTAAQPQFLLALDADIAPGSLSLSSIVGPDVPFDVSIPTLRLSISSSDVEIAADDLDAATAAFLGPDEDLSAPNGVVLLTDIRLEQSLIDITGALGISSDGVLSTELRVPLLGYTSLETSVTVRFPELTGDGVFQAGNVSLEAKQSGASFSFKIVGAVDLEVPRDQDPLCQDPQSIPADHSCTDELTFGLEASVSVAANSFGVELAGELSAEDGWVDPTGLRGITIYRLRLQGGVAIEDGLPQVTIGFAGQLSIDGLSGNRQPIALTTAFSLGITANPPYLKPRGFTFASDGFGLADVTTVAEVLMQSPIDALNLPADLRLEDVFVSVSSVTDPGLCLTQGFTIQAQLHLGGQKEGSGVPACSPTNSIELTDDCAARTSCLAALSVDVRSSVQGSPGLTASAFLAGFDLGVIKSDGVLLELEITPTVQRLYIEGEGRLEIPLAPPQEPLRIASASVLLDLTPTQLIADVAAELGDPAGATFGVRMRAEGRLDLADPQFVFEVEFNTELLEEIGLAIETGVNDMVAVIDELLVVSTEDALIFNNLQQLLDQRADTPDWLKDVVDIVADIEAALEDVNSAFESIDLPPPFVLTEIRNIVLNGVSISSGGIPAIDYGDPSKGEDGCANLHGRSGDNNCYTIPPIELTITGICDDAALLASAGPDVAAVLCGDFSGGALVDTVFEQNVVPTLGAPLPSGLTADELLNVEGPTLIGADVAVQCGGLTIDTVAGQISDPAVTVQVGARSMLVGLEADPFGTGTTGLVAPGGGVEAVLGHLAGQPEPSGSSCTADSTSRVNPEADIAFEVAPGDFDRVVSVVEGSTSVALVLCDAPTAAVTFGDGGLPVVVDMNGGNDSPAKPDATSELVTHRWLRDSAPANPFRPVVECGDGRSALDAAVEVVNGAVVIDDFTVNPDPLAANSVATVEVRFTDAGNDAHTVELRGNGVPTQVIELPARSGSTRAAQRVATFDVVLPDGNTSYKPTVSVEDEETADKRELIIPLREIAPTVVSLTPVEVRDSSTAVRDGNGNLLPREGQNVMWQLTIDEPNLTQDVTVDITFGDGTTETVLVPGSDRALVTNSDGSTAVVPVGFTAQRSIFVDRTERDDGDTPWTIRLVDAAGLDSTTQIAATIYGAPPVIVSDTIPAQVRRTAPFGFELQIRDAGVDDSIAVLVEWGDGTSSTADSASNGTGVHTVSMSHTYTVAASTRLIRVTVTDSDGLSTILLPLRQITILPAAPQIVGWTIPAEVDEWQGFDFSYDFTADGNELYFVSFELLETGGSGSINGIDVVNGQATVTFSALVKDDDPIAKNGGFTPSDGIYTVRATVRGLQTGLTATDTRTFRVRNLDPIIEEAIVAEPSVIQPNVPLRVVVRYTDPGLADTHSVTIDWGDGTISEPTPFIYLMANNRQFANIWHTYTAPGTYEPVITLVDDNGGSDSGSISITVVEPAPQITVFEPIVSVVDEGGDGGVVVSFDDTTVGDSHTLDIDWGDGTTTSMPAEPGTTEVTHVWTQDGVYDIAIMVTDTTGQSDEATTSVTVDNVAPSIVALEPSIGIDEGSEMSLSIQLEDPGSDDVLDLVIDWGDGSPVETFADAAVSLSASHVYADDGVYTVTATVTDDAGASETVGVDVIVNNVAPSITASLSSNVLFEGGSLTVDIEFDDPSVVDSHTVTVDWGAGWTETDAPVGLDATGDDARFSVAAVAAGDVRLLTASNTYGDDGVFDITVRVIDDDGGESVQVLTLVVDNVDPTGGLSVGAETLFVEAGQPLTLDAIADDLGSDDLTFVWTVDGVVVAEQISTATGSIDLDPSPQVGPRASIGDVFISVIDTPCLYEVGVQVRDDDGGLSLVDTVFVVVQGVGTDDPLSVAQWRKSFRTGAIDSPRFGCLVEVVAHLSGVLNLDDLTVVDGRGVPVLLNNNQAPGNKLLREQQRLDQAMFVSLLNVAAGSLDLTTAGADGSTLADLLVDVETVRATSTDWKAVRDAAHRVESW